jgi:hypothetical protein
MKTELRLFVVPMATPFVHMNPFQWKIVGSEGRTPSETDALPTAQPSFGSIGPVKGGPNEIEVKLLIVGLVTVP